MTRRVILLLPQILENNMIRISMMSLAALAIASGAFASGSDTYTCYQDDGDYRVEWSVGDGGLGDGGDIALKIKTDFKEAQYEKDKAEATKQGHADYIRPEDYEITKSVG